MLTHYLPTQPDVNYRDAFAAYLADDEHGRFGFDTKRVWWVDDQGFTHYRRHNGRPADTIELPGVTTCRDCIDMADGEADEEAFLRAYGEDEWTAEMRETQARIVSSVESVRELATEVGPTRLMSTCQACGGIDMMGQILFVWNE